MNFTALLRLLPWGRPSNRTGRAWHLQPHQRRAGHQRSFVPRLEVLESRLAPAVLIVNTLADETTADNFLSLREAIGVVNAGSISGLSSAELAQISGTLGQNDTIQVAHSLADGTITLSSGQLAITRNLAIAGPGAGELTISGNAASRIFDISGGSSFSIAGLTLAHGLVTINTDSGGGCILNESGGTLNVSACTFTANQAITFIGGAIWNQFGATAAISDCTFTDNQVIASDNFGPTSLASECEGGAIDNDGTMAVANSIFHGNQAIAGNANLTDHTTVANAGGIANDGTLTVTGSTFSDNQALCRNTDRFSVADGGGIASFGALTVTDCTFTGNQAIAGNGAASSFASGGGIEATLFSTLAVMNSTLTGNLAMGGAGASGAPGGDGVGGGIDIRSDSTATIMNTVISHNQAIGGVGGAGAAGGNGIGAGIAVGSGVLGGIFGMSPDTSSLILSGSTLDHNQAIGGEGGTGGHGGDGWGAGLAAVAGTTSISNSDVDHNQAIGGDGDDVGNGGNGFGGGIYIAGGASVSLAGCTVNHNRAQGGEGDDGGSDGQGVGGGVYNLGTFSFDFATVIAHNHASTSNDDTFGV